MLGPMSGPYSSASSWRAGLWLLCSSLFQGQILVGCMLVLWTEWWESPQIYMLKA